jgi:hypothetical protein
MTRRRFVDPAIIDSPVNVRCHPIPHPIGEAFVMLALIPGLVVGMLLVMP